MSDIFLTSEGELSLLFVAIAWVVTLVGTIPYLFALKKTEPGSASRISLSRNLALVAFWPAIAMIALSALPFAFIWLIMGVLSALAPAFITIFVVPLHVIFRRISGAKEIDLDSSGIA